MKLFRFLFFVMAFFLGGTCAFIKNNRPPSERIVPVKKRITKHDLGDLKVKNKTSNSRGKTLFRNNCAACHNKNMKDDLTGPALAGVEERWADYPREDLYRWIKNSSKMIEEKHERAMVLWGEWKPSIMNNFNHLNDDDIDAILDYIKEKSS